MGPRPAPGARPAGGAPFPVVVPPQPGRSAFVISQLYYYLSAVIGVGLVIGGGIATVLGLRAAILPEEFETARNGFSRMLGGVPFLLVGLATLWWHLREARTRDDRPFPQAFWGASLYFHGVALVALVFVLVGAIGALNAGADLVLPECYATSVELESGGAAETTTECYPSPGQAGRNALDSGLILLVALPVWLWHLRQGRKLTASGRS